MIITLPAKSDGSEPQRLDTAKTRRAVVIGANGAGKTRFADALAVTLGDKAYRLSAIDGLFKTTVPNPEGSDVDRLFIASALPVAQKEQVQTPLDRLLAMLMADELVNLLAFKFAGTAAAQSAQSGRASHQQAQPTLPPTRLDALMRLWADVFPHNRVLVDNGRLLFGVAGSGATFSQRRLSNGERAVLYYGAAMLYAPKGAVVIIDSPEMFLHPSTIQSVWNALEALRPDCTLIYVTHDLEFGASRSGSPVIWVRACDAAKPSWDYQLVDAADAAIDDRMYLEILGERRPVLFIEGDSHSIDAKLYPLIFTDRSVRSLGSCNKVIEATRTFNDLGALHHMQAAGIVDRDRRDDGEVSYLRRKNIMVPEVAEIENLLLVPGVVRAVARASRHDPDKVMNAVKRSVVAMFRHDVRAQAMQHTRHRVKRTVEYRIDGRFNDINALERHINNLIAVIDARSLYENFCRQFHTIAQQADYMAILKYYNQKSMLSGCNVANLCGLSNKDEYITLIMNILRHNSDGAEDIRRALRQALKAENL